MRTSRSWAPRWPPPVPDVPAVSLRPAVLLDRDGTLVDDPGYLADPALVRLLPGAADAVALLTTAGWPVVVVTNQAGIARGLITPAQYAAVEARVAELVAAAGGRIDATYHCPHHPDFTGPCDCRKPGLASYRAAAAEHALDLAASWWIGDRLADVEPARQLGGRGVLVRTGHGEDHAAEALAAGFPVVADLAAAAALVLAARR